jgi:hypothetical protein
MLPISILLVSAEVGQARLRVEPGDDTQSQHLFCGLSLAAVSAAGRRHTGRIRRPRLHHRQQHEHHREPCDLTPAYADGCTDDERGGYVNRYHRVT